MTLVGVNRARYSTIVEPRPSRFAAPSTYRAWCERADRWSAS